MRLVFLIAIVFYSLLPASVRAQSRFDRQQASLLQSSSEQWLCAELKEVNPSYFRCENRSWKLPSAGIFMLYNDSIILSNEHIARFEEIWFPQGDCKRFLSVVAMADVYMPLFKRKAEQLALHPDVAYLPVVLSGCNQRFKGSDAAGLWAMPYLAARKNHLKIDTLVDERLGGDFTTDAALRHYKYMLSIQQGDDWRATVAYRLGPSELALVDSSLSSSAIVESLGSDAADLLRFQAYTNNLLRSVHVENQLSNCFDILGHFQPVVIEKTLRIQAMAAVLAVDEARLRNSNPVYTGEYLPVGYRKVPFVLEDTVVARYTALKDSIARWQPIQPKIETTELETYWVQHRVGKGETLGRIAGKYHVTIAQVKSWNKLRNDKIRRGQVLKIEQRRKVKVEKQEPVIENHDDAHVETPIDSLAVQPDTLAPRPVPVAPRSTPQTSRSSSPKYYTVKQGDSLWSIAKKYKGVTEHDLMKWNKCGPNIRPGQRLLIKSK
jgi:membrane-bound lytic murein transglycosylase D